MSRIKSGAALVVEIESLTLVRGFAQRSGGTREILDIDACKRCREGMLGLSQCGHHHLAKQRGVGEWRSVDLLGCAGCAQNIVGGDAALLARQLVAAARPSCTLENAVPHQRLQHRLEMPRRQAMARRQCFSRDWPSAR